MRGPAYNGEHNTREVKRMTIWWTLPNLMVRKPKEKEFVDTGFDESLSLRKGIMPVHKQHRNELLIQQVGDHLEHFRSTTER